MRILLLSNRFPPDVVGGAEVLVGNVARALAQRSHEVTVLTSRYHGSNGREPSVMRELREVVDVNSARSRLGRTRPGRLITFYRDAHAGSSARRLLKTVADVKPDIVYVWNISGVGLISVLRALRKLDVPIVFHLHSYWWQYVNFPETQYSTMHRIWLKRLIIGPVPPLRFTTLIAVSDTVKRAYVDSGCPESRIEVIDNAIDPRFFRPSGEPRQMNGRPVVMYAGRVCAEKGVMVALEAVNLLVHRDGRDVRLRIYGSGDPRYEEELVRYVRHHQLNDVVTFHGLVARDDLIRAYDQADMVLVPSLWAEPFGLVAIEAMARGLPVIASDVGGLRSVIRGDIDGLLVPAADSQALVSAITWLSDRPDEGRRLGDVARHMVRSRYRLDACIQRIERHLERALEREIQESRWATANAVSHAQPC